MKSIMSIKRMSRAQVAAMSFAQTQNVISVFESTKAPVKVERANVGTTVRPEVGTIVNGSESVESFLARGGSIKRGKTRKMRSTPTVRCSGSGWNRFANRGFAAKRADYSEAV